MKVMNCNLLGGACDHEFQAETFEEIAEMSRNHGMEMFKKGDKPHLKAMAKMKALMTAPDSMNIWYAERKKEFDILPNIE